MYIGENRLIMNWNNYISLATFVLHDKLVICQIVDTLMGVGGGGSEKQRMGKTNRWRQENEWRYEQYWGLRVGDAETSQVVGSVTKEVKQSVAGRCHNLRNCLITSGLWHH